MHTSVHRCMPWRPLTYTNFLLIITINSPKFILLSKFVSFYSYIYSIFIYLKKYLHLHKNKTKKKSSSICYKKKFNSRTVYRFIPYLLNFQVKCVIDYSLYNSLEIKQNLRFIVNYIMYCFWKLYQSIMQIEKISPTIIFYKKV